MIAWRRGIVTAVTARWSTMVVVELENGQGTMPALADTALVGEICCGDEVLANATSLLQGLGTGGQALIVANLARLPPDPPQTTDRARGHIVKARYTSTQVTVAAVEEPDSPHHALLSQQLSLGGTPVVEIDLHSALPAVALAVRQILPEARIGYVMTDSASLPIAYSRLVDRSVDAGLVNCTVTAGQCYGGHLEAVSTPSALLAAAQVGGCDLIIAGQGPGNAGTGTPLGFSGVALTEVLHNAASLGGRPILAARVSQADKRARHRGLSHHTQTILTHLLWAPATLPLPRSSDSLRSWWDQVAGMAEQATEQSRADVQVVRTDADDLLELLQHSPVPLMTMGRSLTDDATPFIAAAVAGRYAARLLRQPAS